MLYQHLIYGLIFTDVIFSVNILFSIPKHRENYFKLFKFSFLYFVITLFFFFLMKDRVRVSIFFFLSNLKHGRYRQGITNSSQKSFKILKQYTNAL